jgi:hypothetical protein
MLLRAPLLKNTTISRGLLRLDLDDVKLPPVVVHVEVPPVADAGYTEAAEAMIDNRRDPGFKLLRGLHGEFLATYGEHTINIFGQTTGSMCSRRWSSM